MRGSIFLIIFFSITHLFASNPNNVPMPAPLPVPDKNDSVPLSENSEVAQNTCEIPVEIALFSDSFRCYYINEQKMPLVISPIDMNISLSFFQNWAEANRDELKLLINEECSILLRNFPLANAEDFANVVRSIVGRELLNYRSGEGSRKKIVEGVYTSTEAPSWVHIPLHNELSCTNHPASYICFYCDIAPAAGSGQTILGRTETCSEAIRQKAEVWDFFYGKNIRYITRHPPEGSLFSKINVTHRTWQDAFETSDKDEVERICTEKELAYQWLGGNWLEVSRLVPAIKAPDEYYDHDYWFNQVHLYHGNPRIRGGWVNHILANLVYIVSSTRQYQVELEDGTPIPTELVYAIYDTFEPNVIKFDWKKGDALILDNHKAMHGRAPYKGERRILVAMVQ